MFKTFFKLLVIFIHADNTHILSLKLPAHFLRTFNSTPNVIIYTDGACSLNPGPGGWGVIMQSDKLTKEIYGHDLNTTNNRMELTAAVIGLKTLKTSCSVKLYTDSIYLQRGVTEWFEKWQKNNWMNSRKKPVKNLDLWKELHLQLSKHKVDWIWLKGHGYSRGNELADRLAVRGREMAVEILLKKSPKKHKEY